VTSPRWTLSRGTGTVTSQILIKLGEISAQMAVMAEQLRAVSDHEVRLRALERYSFKTIGAAVGISAVMSAIVTWVGVVIHG
jgi:hypothetical protein